MVVHRRPQGSAGIGNDRRREAREEEKQRKLKLIREGAGYVHKELVKAGLISEDTDLMEGLTYKQFRDKMYDEQLDAYYNMKRAD